MLIENEKNILKIITYEIKNILSNIHTKSSEKTIILDIYSLDISEIDKLETIKFEYIQLYNNIYIQIKIYFDKIKTIFNIIDSYLIESVDKLTFNDIKIIYNIQDLYDEIIKILQNNIDLIELNKSIREEIIINSLKIYIKIRNYILIHIM